MNNRNTNDELSTMNKWIIVLVAHDDAELEPQVIKEQLADDDDEQMAAFMRGGELVDVLVDEIEEVVEARRCEIEKTSLRMR